MRHRVDNSKIKFISTRGHVISYIFAIRLFAITEAISYHIESMSPVAFGETDIGKFLAMSVFFLLHMFASFFLVS